MSSTCGSTPGRCRTPRCTTRSRTSTGSTDGRERRHFPGDFIVEYIGQTRGWFYTLHVLATALFDKPAFKTCVAHGIVLGNDGQKMSKSLRNYPDVYRGVRPRRLRRHAVVPDGLADPARRQPDRHRAGHPRRRAPGAAAVLERLHLPGPLRTESRHLAHGFAACAGPLHPGQARRSCATTSPTRWTSATSPVPASSCASSPRR